MPDEPVPPTGPDSTLSQDAPAPIPELVALGRQFRAARQSRGLDLEALAERLCIGHEQLKALENADTSRLPELVFVIALVRRVAAILGVDAEEAVAALRAAAPAWTKEATPSPTRRSRAQPAQAGRAPTPARARAPERAGSRPPGPLLAGAALLLSTAAVGLGLLWQRSPSAPGNTGPVSSSAPQASSAPTTAPAIPPSAPVAKAPAPAGPALLVLRSQEPSWLEVRDSQGATLFEGTLQGEKRFPLGQGLRVMAGRPDLVRAAVEGQEPRVLGPINQVIWRSFAATPQRAKAAAASPDSPKAPAP
ncbi:helix-turn-helix domain-containing protein [Vulcanococcus limneticus]|uniref:helix-turn-helix domain-containing protein n=1 Tax=Vulcanococcus limneticus TaxID=2170428 RepID=UPI00398BE7C7